MSFNIQKYTIELYDLDSTNGKFIKKDIIYSWKNLSYLNKLNGVGSCRFDLNIYDPRATINNLSRYKTQIVIKRNGHIVWFGPMTKFSGNVKGVDGTFTIEGNTYLFHLKNRLTNRKAFYPQTDQGSIMTQLIDDAQNRLHGNLLISHTSTPTSIPIDKTYEYATISDALVEIATSTTGIDFGLDPVVNGNGDLTGVMFNTYYPSIGSIRKDLPSLKMKDNVHQVSFATNKDIVNSVVAVGSGIGDNVPTIIQENPDSSQGFVRNEKFLSRKDLSLGSDLNTYCQFYLNKYSLENYDIQVSITPGKRPYLTDIGLGDFLNIDLHIGNFNISQWLRIFEIDVDIDANSNEIVSPRFQVD